MSDEVHRDVESSAYLEILERLRKLTREKLNIEAKLANLTREVVAVHNSRAASSQSCLYQLSILMSNMLLEIFRSQLTSQH